MHDDSQFAMNIRLLCGYSRSISDACRSIGISRPQFAKYLAGKSFPSFRSLQRICDHFGLEEWEILLPHPQFRDLIVLNPPNAISKTRPFKTAFEAEVWKRAHAGRNLSPFLGYWYSHFTPKEYDHQIQRSLVRLFEVDGVVFTRNIERVARANGSGVAVTKFDGIAYYSGHRIYISERDQFLGNRIWHTTLYASTTEKEGFFSGLTMGSTSDSIQDIACYRSIFQYLGGNVSVRKALAGCGLYPEDSPEIPIYVRERVRNRIESHEKALSAG